MFYFNCYKLFKNAAQRKYLQILKKNFKNVPIRSNKTISSTIHDVQSCVHKKLFATSGNRKVCNLKFKNLETERIQLTIGKLQGQFFKTRLISYARPCLHLTFLGRFSSAAPLSFFTFCNVICEYYQRKTFNPI